MIMDPSKLTEFTERQGRTLTTPILDSCETLLKELQQLYESCEQIQKAACDKYQVQLHA